MTRKEKALKDKEILEILRQENYLHIPYICENCLHNVIKLVTDNYNDVDFSVMRYKSENKDDGTLFSLVIVTHTKDGLQINPEFSDEEE